MSKGQESPDSIAMERKKKNRLLSKVRPTAKPAKECTSGRGL